jgi:hypothetical protein
VADDLISGSEFNDAFDVVSNFLRNATLEYAKEPARLRR